MMAPYSHALVFSLLILTTSVLINAAPAPSPYTAPSPAPSPGHHHHHRHHPHSPAPAYPPTHAHLPVEPPTTTTPAHPPVKPPTHPPVKPTYSPLPRKFVAVQGVVYCKNCTYAGIETLNGASPLKGATVEVRCRNTKYQTKALATTDKNGYFFVRASHQITTYGAHKCLAFLAGKTKSGGPCGKATNMNGGVSGGVLFLDKKQFESKNNKSEPLPNFLVYNVGPFAYEPIKCYKQ